MNHIPPIALIGVAVVLLLPPTALYTAYRAYRASRWYWLWQIDRDWRIAEQWQAAEDAAAECRRIEAIVADALMLGLHSDPQYARIAAQQAFVEAARARQTGGAA